MADDLHYVPGDFYRLDDRSGFKVRAGRMFKEWTELIVDRKLYEFRPAQDFVKGVVDDQSVPEPRPRPSGEIFDGPLQVTLVAPPGPLLLENQSALLLEDNQTQLTLEGGGTGVKTQNIFDGGVTFVYPPGSGH